MKNTFVTLLPGREDFKKEDFILNLRELTSSNTGFAYPDYEIIIECEENNDNFTLDYIGSSIDEEEHSMKINKLVVSIIHTDPFFEMINEEKFVSELYSALSDPKYYEPSKDFDFTIYIMKSASI